jgi:hypothetical protein
MTGVFPDLVSDTVLPDPVSAAAEIAFLDRRVPFAEQSYRHPGALINLMIVASAVSNYRVCLP